MIRSEGRGSASGEDYYGRCELHVDQAMLAQYRSKRNRNYAEFK